MLKDYMQRACEVKEHPDAYATMEKIAAGDKNVYNFLVSMWNFEHVFDDLVDESAWEETKKEQAHKALCSFLVNLLTNPFVQAHNVELMTLFVSAIQRNIGGDHIAEDPRRSKHAAATRCADIDILAHVAGIVSGWDSMIEISKGRDPDNPEDEARVHTNGVLKGDS